MANDKTVLITGATGQQGGAVARELLAKGWKVRALTRKPDGDKARELAALGAEIIRGDLDDAQSLRDALAGVWGVWAVQNTWEAGVEKEEVQGKLLAQLAKAAGVQHYVYTSVGSAHRKTGIPHFENKWRVEETIRGLKFPSTVIIRPVFFMENLLGPWFLQGDKLAAALAPTTAVQMVAVEDIGKIGAIAFERATQLNGAEIDIAGDSVTIPQAAEILGAALGKKLEFVQLPISAIRASSEDFALMLEWFERTGYNADIQGVQRTYDVKFSNLREWASKHAR